MIYLLSKSRLSGYFVELRSYALFLKMDSARKSGKLPRMRGISYEAVYGDEKPALLIIAEKR